MANWRRAVSLIALIVVAHAVAAHEGSLSAVRRAVEKRIAESHADVGVAFRTLDGDREYFYRADDSFHAASTMKVPVMIELFHQVKERRLRLTGALTIHNEFHSIVDNSPTNSIRRMILKRTYTEQRGKQANSATCAI